MKTSLSSLTADAARLAVDTFATLARVLDLPFSTEWRQAVFDYNAALEDDEVPDADVLRMASVLIEAAAALVEELRSEGSGIAMDYARLWIKEWAYHALLRRLLEELEGDGRARAFGRGLVSVGVSILLAETRLQEGQPGSGFAEDAFPLIWQEMRTIGLTPAGVAPWIVPAAGAGIILGLQTLSGTSRLSTLLPRAGFDATPSDDSALAKAYRAAQQTTTLLLDWDRPRLNRRDYEGFERLGPMIGDRTLALSAVPLEGVPASPPPIPPAMPHRSSMYLQARGRIGTVQYNLGDTSRLELYVTGEGGLVLPVPGTSGPALPRTTTAGLGFGVKWDYRSPPRDDDRPGDDDATVSVERASIEFKAGTTGDTGTDRAVVTLEAAVDLHQLEVDLPIPYVGVRARLAFDLGAELRLSSDGAFDAGLRGGVGGEVVIPLNRSLGPLTVRRVRVKVGASLDHGGGGQPGLALAMTTDVTVRIASVALLLDGAGLEFLAGATPDWRGNVAGVARAGLSFATPSALGIEIRDDRLGLEGGGIVRYRSDPERLEFAGHLTVRDRLGLSLLGLWRLGSTEFVALATASISFGPFTGLGLFFANHRTTSPERFLEAARTGELDTILFPTEVVSELDRHVAAIDRLFPSAPGPLVVGVMARLSLYAGRLTLAAGLLLEFSGLSWPDRVYLVAQGRARFPTLDDPVIKIGIDGAGVWDLVTDEGEVRFALRDSAIAGAELTGEALILVRQTRLLSIGGFHPRYPVPPGVYVPARVSLAWARGEHVRVQCRAYIALTPSSLQFGFDADLQARFAGFGIRGQVSLDYLISFARKSLDVNFRVSVQLQLGTRTLLGATFEGTARIPQPIVLRGRACISFLFWTVCSPPLLLELAGGDNRPESATDLAAALATAVVDHANWDNGGSPGLLVARRAADAPPWMSPSAPIAFTQTVAPLERVVRLVGGAPLPQPMVATVMPVGHASEPRTEEFAPAMFFTLSEEAMLSAGGFEAHPAGFAIARPLQAGPGVVVAIEHEDLVVDRAYPPRPPSNGAVGPEVLVAAETLGRGGRPAAPTRTPSVRADHYALLDASGRVVARDLTYLEALVASDTTGHRIAAASEAR